LRPVPDTRVATHDWPVAAGVLPAPVLARRSPRRCPAPTTSPLPIPAPALPVLPS